MIVVDVLGVRLEAVEQRPSSEVRRRSPNLEAMSAS
jgi:hypothetical protein